MGWSCGHWNVYLANCPAYTFRIDYSPETNHYGVDIGGYAGAAIYAVDNGVVVYAGWNDWGYGNMVVIDHGGTGSRCMPPERVECYLRCGGVSG